MLTPAHSFGYNASGGGGYATITDLKNGLLRATWDIDVRVCLFVGYV